MGHLLEFKVNQGVASGVKGQTLQLPVKPYYKKGQPFKITCMIRLEFVWFTWILSVLEDIYRD
jgi:hypothetical protein